MQNKEFPGLSKREQAGSGRQEAGGGRPEAGGRTREAPTASLQLPASCIQLPASRLKQASEFIHPASYIDPEPLLLQPGNRSSGRSVARSSRLVWDQEVASSNLAAPTKRNTSPLRFQREDLLFWSHAFRACSAKQNEKMTKTRYPSVQGCSIPERNSKSL